MPDCALRILWGFDSVFSGDCGNSPWDCLEILHSLIYNSSGLKMTLPVADLHPRFSIVLTDFGLFFFGNRLDYLWLY